MSWTTRQDVAREAGVSLATVDRVLNGYAGVRPRTVKRVQTAIERLNYRPDYLASRLARGRDYRFEVVLPSGTNEFMRQLALEFQMTAERYALDRVHIGLTRVDVFDGIALASVLEAMPRNVDGVALVAIEHPAVAEAVNGLVDRGTTVVTLVSDLPASRRTHFIGVDNYAAGRTAATLLGRFLGGRAGKVGLIAGSLSLRDHIERQYGFEQVVAREYSGLELLPLREARDDDLRVRDVARVLLDQHDDLIGFYNAGAGTPGIVAALEQSGRASEIVFIAHELTASSRRHLIRGTIDALVSQDAGHMARSVARILIAAQEGTPIVPGQERIRIDIFVRDNLP